MLVEAPGEVAWPLSTQLSTVLVENNLLFVCDLSRK